MVTLNIQGLKKDLEASIVRPFYFLVGEEFYFIRQSMDLIKSHLIKSEDELDFNFHQFYLSQNLKWIQEAVQLARVVPAFFGKRLIFLRDIDILGEKDWKILFNYFKNPTPSSTLVLISEREDRGKALKRKLENFFQKKKALNQKNQTSSMGGYSKQGALEGLRKEPCFLEAKRISEKKIAFWIRWIVDQRNMILEPEALSLMSQILRADLSLVDHEIEKLSLNLSFEKKVKALDVLNFLSVSKRENIFELIRWIGYRKLKPSLRLMKSFLDYGESASLILVLIFRHISFLFKIQAGLKEKLSKEKLAQKLKRPSFFIADDIGQARLWDEGQFVYAFKALHEADKRLKTSLIPHRISMDSLLFKMLC